MKKRMFVMMISLLTLLISGCTGTDNSHGYSGDLEPYDGVTSDEKNHNQERPESYEEEQDTATIIQRAMIDQRELESLLSEFATDVVIARYVGHRPFGGLTEFEFVVSEVVVGTAPETIFIYVAGGMEIGFLEGYEDVPRPGEFSFSPEVDYLLPLIRIDSAYSITHQDGFVFIREIIIDLENPSNSTLYGAPLYLHTDLTLDGSIPREDIIAHVYEFTKDNVATMGAIHSDNMEDIITGSPYVLVVEIGQPRRLASEQAVTDWGLTDLYYVTVVESLKGDLEVGDDMVILFHADTVFPGERHIVATRPVVEGYHWHEFTSRHSLFQMEQLDEMMLILNNQ